MSVTAADASRKRSASYPEPLARPAKRTKRDQINTESPPDCYITLLPLEIIAEVLLYTTPRDILALARSNKFFCHTLVKPSSEFIWKSARHNCTPIRIPDPTPNFTEASYAAFLFDNGACEVCGKKARSMFASFTLRLKLCKDVNCRTRWKNELAIQVRPSDAPRYRSVAERLPRAEYSDFGYGRPYDPEGPLELPRPEYLLFRKTQWQQAVSEYNRAALEQTTLADYKATQGMAVSKIERLMKHGLQLVNFRNKWEKEQKGIYNHNSATTKLLARSAGWPTKDLLQTPSFALLSNSRNRNLEKLEIRDFDVIRASVESEIAAIAEKRSRQVTEEQYRQRRSGVATYYETLKKSGEARAVLPTLAGFRKLPVIQILQDKTTTGDVLGEFEQPVVAEMVKQNLRDWQDKIKTSISGLLDSSTLKRVTRNKVHPVERADVRYKCNRCNTRASSKGGTRSLSFADLCMHQCPWMSQKAHTKSAWRAENFSLDPQASAAVDQLLKCIGAKADERESLRALEAIGMRIQCLTCPGHIIMDYDMMLDHCVRHDEMRLEVLSPSQVKDLAILPIERGLCAQLTQQSSSVRTLRERRIYGCRHCQQAFGTSVPAETSEPLSSTTETPSTAPVAAPHASHGPTSADTSKTAREKTRGSQPKAGQGKPCKKFTFDGLRSHAKEKHGILSIGDEDLFQEIVEDTSADTVGDVSRV